MMNKDELKKLKDHKFYLENFCKVKTKDAGLHSFKLKEAQKDIFNEMNKHNRIIILKSRQLGFCLSEDTLVLLSNLKWVKIKDIKIGDSVIAVDENIPGQRKQRKMKTAIVENKFSFKAKTLKITLDNGKVLIGTPEHKMLSKKWECSTETEWKTLGNMKIGTSIRYITNTWEQGNYEDGWFGGMLDGEGSLSKSSRTGTSLNVSQVEGHVLQRLFRYVKNNNITYRVETDDRKCGESSKFGSKVVYKVVVNRMDELFKIIGKTRPSRFLLRKWWENKALPNDGWSKIVSIEDGGMRNVVDLQTSEKTYIANGFVSHNSTAITGFFYVDTIMRPGITTALIGYNSDMVTELLDKIKTFYRTTPDELKPTIQYDSKYQMSFPKMDSKILVLPNTKDVGRGYTIHNCLSGDTEVFTNHGYTKKMKDLNIGEYVVNGKGGLSKIKTISVQEKNEKLLELDVVGCGKLRLTKDHKVLTREYKTGKEIWKRADDLINGDWDKSVIAYPRNFKKIYSSYLEKNENYYWMKIRNIKTVEKEKYVYDIGLDKEPHSFLTTCGVVHNCLVTELSSWEYADEKVAGLLESVPKSGRVVIESCVTGDTIVFTEKGPKYVEDIHDWKNNQLGFSQGKDIQLDGHYGLQPTNTYYNSGVKKGYRIKTKSGYELGMSSVHKIFTLKGDKLEFVKSKDLKIGDLVPIKYGQELWGDNDEINWTPSSYPGFNKQNIELFNPKKITKDLAYLIGVILGDGYVSKRSGQVVITSIDEDVYNFLLDNKLGLKFYKGIKENYYHYYCSNQSFIEFLQDYIGFKEREKAPKKKIPKILFKWSRENIIAFLQGLFDADGSCRKDRGTVSFTSTSKDIIKPLQTLLLNFGILSKVYSYNAKPSKRVKVWSSGYKLEIERGHSKIFLDKIGFRIKRKQVNQKEKNESYDCLKERIPGAGKIVKKNIKELGLKYSDVSHGMNCSLYSKSGNMTHRTLGRILEKCRNKDGEVYKKLKELYDKKYYYDEIKEIIPIEENVYDFTVNNGHTVNYSGIIGHNTPRGQACLYHRLWMTDNEYLKKEYGWWWEYTEKEMVEKKKSIGKQVWAQEYGLQFLASGRNVFDQDIIQEARKNILEIGDLNTPIVSGQQETRVEALGNWTIYRKPSPGRVYILGADISAGVEGGDYSVAIIWDRETGEEVAMYRGLIPPDIFGEELDKWGRYYNNALIVPEVNNHGLTTLTALKRLMYPNMYFRRDKEEKLADTPSDKMGWFTSYSNRTLIVDDLSRFLRDGSITPHSKKLLDEMSVFVYDSNDSMQPQPGFHDDMIFSAGIGLQAFKQTYVGNLGQIDSRKYLPQSFPY